jgi:hypothetical protein
MPAEREHTPDAQAENANNASGVRWLPHRCTMVWTAAMPTPPTTALVRARPSTNAAAATPSVTTTAGSRHDCPSVRAPAPAARTAPIRNRVSSVSGAHA